MNKYIRIHPSDNVVVAIQSLVAGSTLEIDGRNIVLVSDIPAGHKAALQDLSAGDQIIKYGCPIGHACDSIDSGAWLTRRI